MLSDMNYVANLVAEFAKTRSSKSWEKQKSKIDKLFYYINSLPYDKTFKNITSDEIQNFLNTLESESKNKLNYYNTIKSFFEYAYLKEEIKNDIMKDVKKPHASKTPKKYISDQHLKMIDEYIKNLRIRSKKLMNQFLLATLMYTGLSRKYIYSIRKGDFIQDSGNYYLWVGVSDKRRKLPLNKDFANIVKCYLETYSAKDNYDKIFNYSSEEYISSKVARLSEQITKGTPYSPQNFSDTFIKKALSSKNFDIYSVSKLTLKNTSTVEQHLPGEGAALLEKQQKIVDNIYKNLG